MADIFHLTECKILALKHMPHVSFRLLFVRFVTPYNAKELARMVLSTIKADKTYGGMKSRKISWRGA